MIIVHFYVANYTPPIFVRIILEEASNFKKFLPLISDEIGSFNGIKFMIRQFPEDLRNSTLVVCS